MGRFRHKKSGAAFKGAIAVLYLILFSTQLSDKFYLYANSGATALEKQQHEITHKRSAVPRLYSSSNYNHSLANSLDKRYEQEHFFSLAPAQFNFAFGLAEGSLKFNIYRQSISASSPVCTSLRGPPAFTHM